MYMTAPEYIDRYVGRRTRRVFSGDEVADKVAEVRAKAESKKRVVWALVFGGSVPNAYDWPATTMCVFVAAMPDGRALVRVTDIVANKATLSGACAALLGNEYRPIWDWRYNDKNTDAATDRLREDLKVLFDDDNILWEN